jgi:hypothetical protein
MEALRFIRFNGLKIGGLWAGIKKYVNLELISN